MGKLNNKFINFTTSCKQQYQWQQKLGFPPHAFPHCPIVCSGCMFLFCTTQFFDDVCENKIIEMLLSINFTTKPTFMNTTAFSFFWYKFPSQPLYCTFAHELLHVCVVFPTIIHYSASVIPIAFTIYIINYRILIERVPIYFA